MIFRIPTLYSENTITIVSYDKYYLLINLIFFCMMIEK